LTSKSIAAAHHKGKPHLYADCQLAEMTVTRAATGNEINAVMYFALIVIFLRMILTTVSMGRTA